MHTDTLTPIATMTEAEMQAEVADLDVLLPEMEKLLTSLQQATDEYATKLQQASTDFAMTANAINQDAMQAEREMTSPQQ